MTALLTAAGHVESSALGSTAAEVARQQVEVAGAFALLADRLGAAAGMAGDDPPGQAFTGVYGPAADSAFAGFVAALRILDGVTTSLVTTGNNHARAESASGTGPARPPDTLARPSTTAPVARSPAAASRPGRPGPWDLVRDYWPLADPDALVEAASTWHAAGTALADATAALGTAVAYLESGNTGPDVDAIVEFWAGLIGPGHTLFAELERLCTDIAVLCRRYGILVEDTHRSVRKAVGFMLASGIVLAATGVGLAIAAHVELGEVEALLNPVAEEFAARFPAEVLPAVDLGLVESVRQLAADSATPRAVEAELTELEDATDARLGGTAAPPPALGAVPTQVVPRFSADRFADVNLTRKHFRRHASDFGTTTEQSYMETAASFLHYAQDNHLPAFIEDDGVVRVYDPATNVFGSYDSATETIITFFRPTSRTYWENNKHEWGNSIVWEH